MSKRRFIVLDRDGTIIRECNYLSDPDQVELLPGVADGLRKLRKEDLGLVLVTNQSAIGRGLFDIPRLDQIHQRLQELLLAERIYLDGIYYCPHKPDDCCSCRKPKIGLLKLAAEELVFDNQECFVIGDKACDIEMGQRVGATTLLVRTGYGLQVESEKIASPNYIVDDILAAAKVIQCLINEAREKRTNASSQ